LSSRIKTREADREAVMVLLAEIIQNTVETFFLVMRTNRTPFMIYADHARQRVFCDIKYLVWGPIIDDCWRIRQSAMLQACTCLSLQMPSWEYY
jgi:hypothetical protein